MPNRVANKKNCRVPPARSTKSRARQLAKIKLRKKQIEAARKRLELREMLSKAFGDI